MTNFIYNMQDELFHLNMVLPVGDFSIIKKLVDHIEAQGKQLRKLNKAITKKNATIAKYEHEKDVLQKSNSCLIKKVDELNNGIRDSEDRSWKQKYDALLHSSEQAISALQKKCQEYKNTDTDATENTIAALVKENNELKEKNKNMETVLKNNVDYNLKLEEKVKRLDARIKELIILCDEEYDNNNELKEKNKKIDELEEENKELKEEIDLYIGVCNTKHEEIEALAKAVRCPLGNNWYVEEFKKLKEDLEKEKQVSKDLNAIINSKNKLLDEYMTKCNNLEHNYKEEVRMKEQLKTLCFRHERTIKSQNSTIKYLLENWRNISND